MHQNAPFPLKNSKNFLAAGAASFPDPIPTSEGHPSSNPTLVKKQLLTIALNSISMNLCLLNWKSQEIS